MPIGWASPVTSPTRRRFWRCGRAATCARLGPAYLVCDCANVGPDYLPGHAHADTLSFELSLDGRRLFVNSGTSVYGIGPERIGSGERPRTTP